RQVLHSRIAQALRDRFPTIAETEPEVAAYHFTQAGIFKSAIEWWGKAGERAMQSSAYSEAIAHLKKALDLADKIYSEPWLTFIKLRLQSTYAYALLHSRGPTSPDAIAAFERARELAA